MKIIILGTGIGKDGGTGRCLYNLLTIYKRYAFENDFYVALQNDESLRILQNDFPGFKGVKIEHKNFKSNIINRLLFKFNIKYPSLKTISKKTNLVMGGVDITNEHFDIAISFSSIPSLLFLFLSQKLKANCKIAWQHSDLSKKNMKILENKSNMKQKCLFMYRNCFKQYNKIICVSNQSKEDLVKIFPLIKEKSFVIHNPFVPAKTIKRKSFTNTLHLLSVGRVSYEKGIDIAIKSAITLKEKNVDFTWTFVGDNKRILHNVYDLINKHDITDNIYFVGEKIDLSSYYEQASIFCLTSRLEGYPTVLNEAKSYGIPIISTNVSGASDIVDDGLGGYILSNNPIKLAKTIISLWNDKEKLHSFSDHNFKYDFDKENERIIESLILLLKAS